MSKKMKLIVVFLLINIAFLFQNCSSLQPDLNFDSKISQTPDEAFKRN